MARSTAVIVRCVQVFLALSAVKAAQDVDVPFWKLGTDWLAEESVRADAPIKMPGLPHLGAVFSSCLMNLPDINNSIFKLPIQKKTKMLKDSDNNALQLPDDIVRGFRKHSLNRITGTYSVVPKSNAKLFKLKLEFFERTELVNGKYVTTKPEFTKRFPVDKCWPEMADITSDEEIKNFVTQQTTDFAIELIRVFKFKDELIREDGKVHQEYKENYPFVYPKSGKFYHDACVKVPYFAIGSPEIKSDSLFGKQYSTVISPEIMTEHVAYEADDIIIIHKQLGDTGLVQSKIVLGGETEPYQILMDAAGWSTFKETAESLSEDPEADIQVDFVSWEDAEYM